MINKTTFISRMEALKVTLKDIEKYISNNKLSSESVIVTILDKCVANQINFLSDSIEDSYAWISWYVYEVKCGENPLGAVVKGSKITVKTIEDLYEVILLHAK